MGGGWRSTEQSSLQTYLAACWLEAALGGPLRPESTQKAGWPHQGARQAGYWPLPQAGPLLAPTGAHPDCLREQMFVKDRG